MEHRHPPPDQALAEHPLAYSDPELRAYAERLGTDPAAPPEYRQRCREAARAPS